MDTTKMADPTQYAKEEPADHSQILFATIALSVGFIAVGMWLLPEHCMILETRDIGFLCDGIDLTKPNEPCTICSNEAGAAVARIIFFSGFVLWLLPVFFLKLREKA